MDYYTLQLIYALLPDNGSILYIYTAIHILILVGMIILGRVMSKREGSLRPALVMFSIFSGIYLTKFVIFLVLFGEDIVRFFLYTIDYLTDMNPIFLSRIPIVSKLALAAGTTMFGLVAYGMTRGKYRFTLHRIKIPIVDLPPEFEGFTITQLSDIHTGSLDSLADVKRGIKMANDLKSDVICFTGDIINMSVKELEGFEEILSSLSAPHGVYSVLGNHDYADFTERRFSEPWKKHLEDIIAAHKSFGWKLLMNESEVIRKGDASLAIVGVENWGRGFSQYGRLDEAMAKTPKTDVTVLLSHDPSHWDAQIRPNYPNIDLTLSGHTHGLQIGIDTPYFKFSLSRLVYKQWADLYKEGEQYIYVNRGFGFHGFFGRIGIWPEITQLTLTKAS